MGKLQRFSEHFWAFDRRRLGAIAVLLLDALILAAFVLPQAPERITASYRTTTSSAIFDSFNAPFEPLQQDRTLDSRALTNQSFYPYSVIPGGARDANQLRNAVAQDPTVRVHYANFVVASTRVERLEKTQAFYVSYRIGNDIYWTKNAVTIRAGETVLSDGEHIARTRCGNRLSAVPVAPTAKNEPAPAAMEIADAGTELASIETPAEMPVAAPPATAIAAPPAVPGAPVGTFAPPLPFFPIGSGTPLPPGSPSTPPSGPTPPTGPTPPSTPPSGPTPPATPPSGPTPPAIPPATPPVPAPEPSALLMLASGIGFALLLKKSR